jgi:AraC-like DNA-binding protein
LTLAELAVDLGCSERRLQRVFSRRVGLSPKEFLRLCRFQQTIKGMNRQSFETVARTAHENGFYDEAHLARDFKDLVGEGPNRFKKFW